MAEIEKVNFEEAINRLLLSQYDKPNMKSLFSILATMATDEQNIIFELRDRFWIEDAAGEQLDFLGALWNVFRGALTDDAYRAEIYTKVAQTFSGTVSEIKTILIALYGGTYAYYSPEYPAGYRVRTDALVTTDILEDISPAGVKGYRSGWIRHLSPQGYLVDAVGHKIAHIDERMRQDMIDATGDLLLDASDTQVVTAGFY